MLRELREATEAALARADGRYPDPLGAVVEAACGVVARARGLRREVPYDDALAGALAGWAAPGAADHLGTVYEQLLAARHRDRRRSAGAFYTPPALVAWVLDRALRPGVRRVLDPACGTGHFLVAAARRLGDTRAVHGSDTDATAVRVCRFLLWLEDPSLDPAGLERRVRVADGLTAWRGETFDAVVGNPPFLGQLRRRTAGEAGGLGAYTDTSAVFLHRSLDLVGDGGTVALVQPLSVLAARDAAPVRAAVRERGAVSDLWAADRPVFEGASVLSCVPVVRVGAEQTGVVSWTGVSFARAGVVPLPEGEWGPLAGPAFDVPTVDLADPARGDAPTRRSQRVEMRRLGELATCTADFRDQYYGLVPHVRDAGAGRDAGTGPDARNGGDAGAGDGEAPLVTSGLIEPAACEWGRRATRFARREYDAPVVDVAALRAAGALAAWADARLLPKVLVAGQGRVVEAVVDEDGGWLPSVPVVSVVPADPADLWRVLAVLLAPPVVAHAAARYLGTGLSAGSVKVSARQLAGLPLPHDDVLWTAGAALARAAQREQAERRRHLSELATVMTAAYGADQAVADWWRDRALRSPHRGRQRATER